MGPFQYFVHQDWRQILAVGLPILLSIVSDLVVGLTPYPRTDGALKVLLRILNVFATVNHSDSPGTLKPPLVMSPRPVPKNTPLGPHDVTPTHPLIPAALLLLALGFASSAHAQAISMGPTIPVIQVRLADPATNKTSTGLLASGAGYQLGFGFLQRSLLGKEFDLIDIDLLAFGTINSDAGNALDRASLAAAVCTLNSLVCLGFGVDLVQYYGGNGGQLSGILAGNVGRQNLFPLLSVGFNFAVGPYAAPATNDGRSGAQGLERGNTVYVGF